MRGTLRDVVHMQIHIPLNFYRRHDLRRYNGDKIWLSNRRRNYIKQIASSSKSSESKFAVLEFGVPSTSPISSVSSLSSSTSAAFPFPLKRGLPDERVLLTIDGIIIDGEISAIKRQSKIRDLVIIFFVFFVRNYKGLQ